MTRHLLAWSALMLGGCAVDGDIAQATFAEIDPPDLPDEEVSAGPCLHVEPDAFVDVPHVIPEGGIPIRSENGAYAYDGNGCGSFIVDVRQDWDSNATQDRDGNWSPHAILIVGSPFDLPSSAGYGGTEPTTQYDCERFRVRVLGYERAGSDPTFPPTPVYSGVMGGTWNGDVCDTFTTDVIGSLTDTYCPSGEGSTYRRWLVQVMERGTAQQAQVTVDTAPPDRECTPPGE